jgi:hypothetical protein
MKLFLVLDPSIHPWWRTVVVLGGSHVFTWRKSSAVKAKNSFAFAAACSNDNVFVLRPA